ncbi:low affinity potassium transport system protein kup [Sideroxyarcus emersonii]|uniref:Probable potassium transport system protein Kup n=1 Tax=Sideroxyarcus emersonii TaxID=2764705 RepID=A0AAN1XC13_9PROT|nr:potassium transporter Kup [Sideroxyarcus emersonii]BCK88323.1 low affinity potassium transport system protein kup [Sideroxyarcus emersonii]
MNQPSKASNGALALAALGVVYGDIGTSPLYAFKEAFTGTHGLTPTEPNVLATLSALFWAMMLIISIKYVWIMLKFDNDGEGGVLALTALANRSAKGAARWTTWIVTAGIFAAALFYGDALITPAISVLSAVEGLSVATPAFEKFIVPITVGVLAGLFFIQRHGTGSMGKLFGPVTLLWFTALAVLGALSIAQNPTVLSAVNPVYAIDFALEHPAGMFLLLSAVFLALTGGEALYADMGHFGAKPVRLAWYGLVCPALLINYFGQGALVLRSADAIQNPFYLLSPDWFLLPLVALATAATVIASQATISGAYSMTLQAMRMGYLPRLYIQHTSDSQRGQIYIPAVNWMMMVGVIVLVFQFGSSSALAAAYGIAVSGTMIITTVLTVFVALMLPGRMRILMLPALLIFALLELMFFSSNLTKIASGGWMPLALGLLIFLLLSTWKRGSTLIAEQRRKLDIPMALFISGTQPEVPRVPGTAVYLTADPTMVPSALFHNLKHFKVLHEQTLFLHVVTADVPYIEMKQRMQVNQLAPGMYNVALHFGFRQEVDIPASLQGLSAHGIQLEPMSTTFFIARSNVADGPGGMPAWRSSLFSWMTRQSEGAASFFNLPANQVVELGTKVML